MDYFKQIHALLTLIDHAPIASERRLQKIACLADLPFRFELREMGPYSFELKAMVMKQLETDMIKQEKTYMLTETGRIFLNRLSEDGYQFNIDENVILLTDFTIDRLEAMATLKYLKEIGYPEQTAKEKIAILRPNLKAVL